MISILQYNGSAVVAMCGKNCVAIGTDTRYGIQTQLVATNKEKVFQFGPHLYVGLPGLVTDAQSVLQTLTFRKNMYELKEERRVQPKVLSKMVSNLLYEKRFGPYFVEPVIAGLDNKMNPYICNMDIIGCVNETNDFVVAGTCSGQMYGMCESLWEPEKEPDDLFETISQALTNAVDRDAMSGWGAIVYLIEKDSVKIRSLKTRMD